jgi:DNA repair exonuclease SbcCD ATPase subunit
MRNINFRKVGMKNYGPHIDPVTIDIKDNQIVFITGPNGIGKTMAIDAIPFALYGVTSKGSKGDDVVNNNVGKNCHVWLEFDIDGTPYKIDRYTKYTKLGNTVHIFKNQETEPYKRGQKEVLPEVERLICSQKSFMNTIMFGQKVKDFFTDLVDSDKKEIFRKILNLDVYQTYYKRTVEIIDDVEKQLTKNSNESEVNKTLTQDAIEQLESLKERKREFERNKAVAIEEIKSSIQTNKRLL